MRYLKYLVIICSLVIILILIASPLTRFLIEKNGVKFTGRKISVGRAYVNPLTGSLNLRNIRMFELNGDSVFFSVRKLSMGITLLKLISGTYQIRSMAIESPEMNIIQTDSTFNFSDLVSRFQDTSRKLRVNVLNMKLDNGTVHYTGKMLPSGITINNINFYSPGKYWNVDSVSGRFSLDPGNSRFSGNFMLNTTSMNYRFKMKLKNFDPGIAKTFLQRYAGNASLYARVDADLDVSGNTREPMNLTAMGRLAIDSLRFGPGKINYLSTDRLVISFPEISPGTGHVYFDSLYLKNPYILFQKFDTLDNFRRMFRALLPGKKTKKTGSEELLAKLRKSDYFVNLLEIKNGKFEFNDYSIAEKFSMVFYPFNLNADTIDKNKKKIHVSIKSGIIPYGNLVASLKISQHDGKNIGLNFNFKDISAASFNPYIATFTSYQLDRGTIELKGDWNIVQNELRASNHFVMINPRTTEKVKGKETKKVPLPLIMAFIKERGSGIDYEIPVRGKIDDPKVKLGNIITDLLRNILVKPPSIPYQLKVTKIEESIEKTLTLRWKMRSSVIETSQDDFLKRIAGFLDKYRDAWLTIAPVYHEEKEKENIAMFEAKKQYLLSRFNNGSKLLSKEDSSRVEKLSSKDSMFLRFLNHSVKNSKLMTLQEKCYDLVGRDIIDKQFESLDKARKNAFLYFFRQNGTDARIEFLKNKNEVPFNWFSYFNIEYKGEVPEALREAFGKLYEYNTEPPRRKFFRLLQR